MQTTPCSHPCSEEHGATAIVLILLQVLGWSVPYAECCSAHCLLWPSATAGSPLQIAPRAGLLRVREFTLAEIEHFVNPSDKRHPRFKDTAPLTFLLYPRAEQLGPKQPVEMNLGEAVAKVRWDHGALPLQAPWCSAGTPSFGGGTGRVAGSVVEYWTNQLKCF